MPKLTFVSHFACEQRPNLKWTFLTVIYEMDLDKKVNRCQEKGHHKSFLNIAFENWGKNKSYSKIDVKSLGSIKIKYALALGITKKNRLLI